MKNIRQSILSRRTKVSKPVVISMCSVVVLLFIVILSCIGKNKASLTMHNKEKLECMANINEPATLPIYPNMEDLSSTSKKAKDILFQSTDGGHTWQNLSAGLPENANINHVLTIGNEVFAGTADGAVYHNYDIAKNDWVVENIGGYFRKEPIMGIFQGQSGPYVSMFNRGVFRRISGTGFWQSMGAALNDIFINAVLETPDGTLYAAGSPGIYKSSDEGKNWQHVFTTGWVSSLTYSDGVIIASGMPGLMRSIDGKHWECTLKDEGAVYKTSALPTGFVALREATPWATTKEANIWPAANGVLSLQTSSDGGKSWQATAAHNLQAKNIYDLEQAGQYLFSSSDAGISRSADGGKNWELVMPNPEKGPNKMSRIELMSVDNIIYAVMVSAGC